MILTFWAAIAISSTALAHKVNIFAYVDNGVVYTESYFPDGRAVENGAIEVYDSQGHKLLEGVSDKEGFFSFKVPKKDDLTIVINASMGHKNNFILKKEEIGD
ncbi:MAG: carboxypeptidase regulatory-like domain-containing protein [Thermodesulfobacteriota bacterium]